MWGDSYVSVGHHARSEVVESLEQAREWCREHITGYANAPRRDAVAARSESSDHE